MQRINEGDFEKGKQYIEADDLGEFRPQIELSLMNDRQQYDGLINFKGTEGASSFMKELIIQDITLADYLKNKHQICFDEHSFRQNMEIAIQLSTENYEALKLNIEYGSFNLNVSVANVDENSQTNCLESIFAGSFGEVHKTYLNNRSVAVKVIPIEANGFQQTFKTVVKEYFFLKIAAALKIGPNLLKIYGFDIVIFRNSIEFSMELCDIGHSSIQGLEESLKKRLSLLHHFHIIHSDIKPENIAFSPSFQSYVFLDFGLSKIIAEEIGEKTMTTFVGSVNYCSKQVKDLFLQNSEGFVDLYYNDAFALSKALSAIFSSHLELEIDSDFEYAYERFYNANDIRYFDQQRLLIVKSVLFDNKLAYSQKIDKLSSLQQTIISFSRKIYDFLLTIPFINELNSFYLKYFQTNSEQFFQNAPNISQSLIKNPRNLREVSQHFTLRYHLIASINQTRWKQYQTLSKINSAEILSNEELVKQLNNNFYILNLVKYIKINGEASKFEDKERVCRSYAKIHSIPLTANSPKLYKDVILSIFNYSFDFQDQEKVQILKEVIQSVIILELLQQQKLTQSFMSVLGSSLTFITKMSIVFEFIIGLQFTRQKFKSAYNFQILTEVYMSHLDKYLDTMLLSKQIKQYQMCVFQKLKDIIFSKIYYVDTNISKISYSNEFQFAQDTNIINEGKSLLHKLETYIVFYETCLFYKNSMIKYERHLQFLMSQIKKHLSSVSFTYIHFIYYQMSFQRKAQQLSHRIYRYFQMQLGPFEQCKSFKIYLTNKVVTFKRCLNQIFLKNIGKDIDYRYHQLFNFVANNKKDLKDMFDILQQIMDNNLEYHNYLELVFSTIQFLQKNPLFVDYSIKFLKKYKMKVISLSFVFHKNTLYHHDNSLKRQMMTTMNMIKCIEILQLGDSSQNIVQLFISQCQDKIDRSKCLMCRVSCSLELKLIKALILIRNKKCDQFVDLMTHIIATYFKYHELYYQISRILMVTITSWYTCKQIHEKYHLTMFLYRYSIDFKDFRICFADCKDLNILIEIYLHILINYGEQEIIIFVKNILHVVQSKRQANTINVFYFNILHIINICRTLQITEDFKQTHNQVVDLILNDRQLRKNPYTALYFSALLQVRIKGVFDSQMMRIINKSLVCIDAYSKGLILSNLYSQAAFYEQKSERRLKYLNVKHIKYEFQAIKLKILMKIMIKAKYRRWKNTFVARFIQCVKSYHSKLIVRPDIQ